MNQLWEELRPVAFAAMCACALSNEAGAAEAQLPETKVSEQAWVDDVLEPSSVPYSTEVLTFEQMEREQVYDIRDVAREMINVEVPRQPHRGTGISGTTGRDGNSGFEIRGLGGNRVQTLIDGIPQPQAESFQSSHSFGRDYVDPLTLSAIEVHKGVSPVDVPAGGIAGAVKMHTLSPSDLLQGKKTLAGRGLLGWRSENHGKTLGLALAAQASQRWQWLIAANGEWSDETQTMGQVGGTGLARTRANPEDVQRRSIMGKLVFQPHVDHTHTLTAEYRGQDLHITNLHDFDHGTTRSHLADEDSTRKRVSLKSDVRLRAGLADQISTYAAWQDSASTQHLTVDTTTQGARLREHRYDERMLQWGLKASKHLGAHALTYGLDWSRMHADTDSFSTDRGVTTAVPKGPDTRTTRWGVFVQDSLEWGALTLTPGLRYESVDIQADASSIDMGASGATPVSKRFDAWLPQLGARWALAGGTQMYANYARGFRAPSAGELNNFFGNVTPYYGYYILPNPHLQAETSNNLDGGVRGGSDSVQWEAGAFYSRYKNFIERYANAGTRGTRPAIALQQSRNQAHATIKGIELKGQLEWGQAWGGRWQLHAGYGYIRGEGADGQGLESISPHQFKLGVGQKAATWNWMLLANHSAAKKKSDLPTNTAALFYTPSFTVLDWMGQVELRKGLRLNVGIFNLTDQKYWNWSDVRGVTAAAEAAAIDAYSQPGRNARVSLVMDF